MPQLALPSGAVLPASHCLQLDKELAPAVPAVPAGHGKQAALSAAPAAWL